jgi:hypothetical protein
MAARSERLVMTEWATQTLARLEREGVPRLSDPDLISRLERATGTDKDEIQNLSTDIAKAVSTLTLLGSYPPYCESLDVALTLMPAGWIIDHLGDDVRAFPNDMTITGAAVRLSRSVGRSIVGVGKTRPLAACIAALKARQSTGAGNVG